MLRSSTETPRDCSSSPGIPNPLALSSKRSAAYRRAVRFPPCFDTVARPDLLSTNGVDCSRKTELTQNDNGCCQLLPPREIMPLL